MKVAENLASAKILRNIGDLDRELCRINHDYTLDTLALIFLCLPVFIGIVSALLADAAFKSVLGGLFSFYVVVNDFLLKSGLQFLLIFYGGVLLYLVWKYLICKPAQKRVLARKNREAAERTTGRGLSSGVSFRSRDVSHHWSHSKRLNKQQHIITQIAKFCEGIMYELSQLVVSLDFHYLWMRFFPSKQRKREMWQKMNIPIPLQGRILQDGEQAEVRKSSPTESEDDNILPEEILAMRRPEWTMEWGHVKKNSYVTNLMNSYLFSVEESLQDAKYGQKRSESNAAAHNSSNLDSGENADDHSMEDNDEQEIPPPLRISAAVQSFIDHNLVAYDAETAGRLIYDKYVAKRPLSINYRVGDHYKIDMLTPLKVVDFISIFEGIWDLYKPSGIELDNVEKQEIEESLNEWIVCFIDETYGAHAPDEALDKLVSCTIPFRDFMIWLRSMGAKIEKQRKDTKVRSNKSNNNGT